MKLSIHEKVVIIGRGIAGLSSAFRLLKAGYSPLVIGSSETPANASRCAQGVLANKGLVFYESPLFAAKLKSLNHVQKWLSQLESESGIKIDRQFDGVYEPYWSPQDFQDLVGRIYRRQFWGCFQSSNLVGDKWPKAPFLAKQPNGCLFYPRDGWFDVNATLDALELILKKAQVQMLCDSIVRISKRTDGRLELILRSGISITSDRIILASGSETPSLLQNLDISTPKSFIVGGQSLKIHLPYETEKPVTFVRGTFTATWRGRELILGSSSWKGASLDEAAMVNDAKELIKTASEKFGWNFNFDFNHIEFQRGARFRFADRMPAVGPCPFESMADKVYFLNGFYKNGLHLADLCSLDLLAYLEERYEDVSYPDFHPKRLFKVKSCSSQLGKYLPPL